MHGHTRLGGLAGRRAVAHLLRAAAPIAGGGTMHVTATSHFPRLAAHIANVDQDLRPRTEQSRTAGSAIWQVRKAEPNRSPRL